MIQKVFDSLLSKLCIHPVLIDIGASGEPPDIWNAIAKHSIYVGFDPDLREMHEIPRSRFYKEIIINKAITSRDEDNEVLFYLTKSPYCSSTLKPDSKSLSHFLFSDLFIVERETRVNAITLNSVIEHLSLTHIDWLKIDTQGTDLRIFNSLKPNVRSRVLAVDIEPGLIDAYSGEDLFIDAHKDLTQNGFWLSNMNIGQAIRMNRSTLNEVMASKKGITASLIERTVKKSPAWVEARYLRTIDYLSQNNFDKSQYTLLWIFALLDGQFGFALDLVIHYEKIFGSDNILQVMKKETIVCLKRFKPNILFATAKSLIPIPIKQLVGKFLKKQIYL